MPPVYVGILLQHGGIGNHIVANVDAGSPAEQAGIRAGDVILQADGRTFASDAALGEYLRTKKPGDSIRFDVWANGVKKLVTVWPAEPAATPSNKTEVSTVSLPKSESSASTESSMVTYPETATVSAPGKPSASADSPTVTYTRRGGRQVLWALALVAFLLICIVIWGVWASSPSSQSAGSSSSNVGSTAGTSTAAPRSPGWNHKAVANESQASDLVGGFSESERQKYHLGLQHIANTHAIFAKYTIAQVVDQERAREVERQTAADRKVFAAQMAAAHKAEVVRQAAAARAQALEAHLFHGSPDCLVLDNRTLTTESGDYAWYIVGKAINQCDHDLTYAQVEFNLFNDAGSQTGSEMANINNLAAGQTWSFRVMVTESTGGTWKLSGLSGF